MTSTPPSMVPPIATVDAVHGPIDAILTTPPTTTSPSLSLPVASVLLVSEKTLDRAGVTSLPEKADIEHQEVADDPRKWSAARKVRHKNFILYSLTSGKDGELAQYKSMLAGSKSTSAPVRESITNSIPMASSDQEIRAHTYLSV